MSDFKNALGIYLRGLAMGAADVVPGVSGGTVAFITGIYEKLINSITAVNFSTLTILREQGIKAAWDSFNGNFLLVLGLGILTSILSLAKVITFLLNNHPLLVWSFFMGLIAASSWHMAKQIKVWSVKEIIVLLLGVAIALLIALIKPSELSSSLPLVFLAGSIAICAMILPGISGSFILVLMGMYRHILEALNNLDIALLATFAAGCGVGLLSFAHFLSWLLKRFHDLAMALLTGFLIGSIYLVWPWKHTITFYEKRKGVKLALEQENVLPATYQQLTGADSQMIFCLALVATGVVLVLILEKIGEK